MMASTSVEIVRPEDEESAGANCLKTFIKVVSVILIIGTFPLSLLWCVKIVREYERAVLFRFGRLTKKKTVGPGLFFIMPCVDEVGIYRVSHFLFFFFQMGVGQARIIFSYVEC